LTETEPQSLEQLAEGLLSPEATEEAPAQERTEAEETPEPEAVEAEADGEDEAEEVEASEVDEEETEDDQEAEEQPDTFTVKVDGKEVQVSLDELTRGYAGQSYIQKGMAENAEARKALEQQYHAVSQQGQQLAALVQSLQTDGLTPPTAPDVSRLETDPIGYFQDKEAYDRAKADHDQRLAAIQHQQAQLQQLQAQAQRQHRAEQMQILHAAIPDFAHPEKGAALQRKLVDIGTVSYTHLRAHETVLDLVCRLLLEKKK